MTREEIISGLRMTMELIQFDPGTGNVRPIYTLNDLDKTTYVACKEAIEALKAQLPSAQPKPCEDAVSRADAFNAINDYVNTVGVLDGYTDTQEVLRIVKRLPSAQPEPLKITIDPPTADELERIKHAMRNTPVMLFPSAQPDMFEYSSKLWRNAYERGKRDAQPARKTGKWEMLPISINPPMYKCSVCGSHALMTVTGCLVNRHFEANLTDFCPNCGADMRGEKHDAD